jgi:putative tryptophan/tyrosine transport system substrate-binding protein
MQFGQLKRRDFITLLGGAAAWPLAARAQQPAGKVPRIGFLQRIQNENVVAFIQGLRDAGYIDGQNAVIETRIFETTLDRLPDLANELVDLKCNVIVAASRYAFEAAMRATSTTPIVGIDLESDPVASGWAKSLGRPGGNFTGLFLDLPELSGKQIELLKEAVPTLSHLAVLWDSTIGEVQFRATQAAARAAGVTLHSLPIHRPEDFNDAFDRAARERIHGVVVLSSPLILEQRLQIAEWAMRARLPTISLFTLFPRSGGLMAYGPNLPDMYKRAAAYVGRILKGTKVADLPIERPTTFELIINLKTAKALGLEIPPTLLARADEVIE